MKGDTAIVKILKAEGVEWIGAFPAQSLIDESARQGVRPIICRQERTGIHMADGYSRITNGKKVGVFTMQTGPGSENSFGAVAQAFGDSVPILLLPGGYPMSRTWVHPNFDAFRNYGAVTKFLGHVNMTSRIPEMMRRAFTHLKHGRLGPALLEIPRDVAAAEIPDEAFSYRPVQQHKACASPEDVRDLVTELLKASSPVIYAGQGIFYAEATDELLEFAELTNIPVMTTLAGKSCFPEDHRLSIGCVARTATDTGAYFLGQADFILGIGTSFTINNYGSALLPKGPVLAQVTNCAEDINKDYEIDLAAIGDAKLVLRQMIEEVKRQVGQHGRGDVHGVAEKLAALKAEDKKKWEPLFNSDEVPMSPYRVMKEMIKALDVRNTTVTHDAGYPRDQFVPHWPALTPHSYIGWGKTTQLGYGLGLAMGAKLAAPERTCINVMGDAAFGMTGMDIETAARCKIGTITVVLNNGLMSGYARGMPAATEKFGANILGGNYAGVAENLGALGIRVKTPDEIGPAIKKAQQATAKGQPVLLEMMTKEETRVARPWPNPA